MEEPRAAWLCENRLEVWKRWRFCSVSLCSGERPDRRVREGGGGGGMMGWCGWKGIRLRGTCSGEKRMGGSGSVNWRGGGISDWNGGGGGGLWLGGGGIGSDSEE